MIRSYVAKLLLSAVMVFCVYGKDLTNMTCSTILLYQSQFFGFYVFL